MANCLYCGREAGSSGFHAACAPSYTHAPALTHAPIVEPIPFPAAHAAAPLSLTPLASVRVVDIAMPFGSMVTFLVKLALAAIPALLILAAFGFLLVGLFVAIGSRR